MGRFALLGGRFFKRLFVCIARIDLALAEKKDVDDYQNIQAIFTRQIELNKRPLVAKPNTFVSPIDGQFLCRGGVISGQVMQVKGIDYSLAELMGEPSQDWLEGSYANFYLSPKDYHRFHAPIGGTISAVRHIPGCLYPVKKNVVASLKVYSRNERVVIEGADHNLSIQWRVVAIGAMGVGSVVLCSKAHGEQPIKKSLTDLKPYTVSIGEVLGYFALGSSIVVVTSRPINWEMGIGEVMVRENLGHF